MSDGGRQACYIVQHSSIFHDMMTLLPCVSLKASLIGFSLVGLGGKCMGPRCAVVYCWWYRLLTGLVWPGPPLFLSAYDSSSNLRLLGRSMSRLTSHLCSYGLPCVGSNPTLPFRGSISAYASPLWLCIELLLTLSQRRVNFTLGIALKGRLAPVTCPHIPTLGQDGRSACE